MLSKVKRNAKGQFVKGLLYGVGIDDTDYPKERRERADGVITIWRYPAYSSWKNMLDRCYRHNGGYTGKVVVDVEWHTFSNFKAWFDKHHQDGWELDKDIMGGKIYSKNHCFFIPKDLNQYLKGLNEPSSGVSWDSARNKFRAYCKPYKSRWKQLGRYDDPIVAKKAWLRSKEENVIKIMNLFDVPMHVRLAVYSCFYTMSVNLEIHGNVCG